MGIMPLLENENMKYFLGAYASSPTWDCWDPELESQYYNSLKTIPNLAGLELPFCGSLHPFDDNWFLENLDIKWNYVLTTIPGVMSNLELNPNFGLASDCPVGRNRALEFYEAARKVIVELNSFLGRKSVEAVEIHSSPCRLYSNSSLNAFKDSLAELGSWDWCGASLCVEHCDAYVGSRLPEKGFLSLLEEIQAIRAVNVSSEIKFGMVVNWARSVIESQNPDTALDHINFIKSHGLLKGIMFSGVSDCDGLYGKWKDSHMPHASFDNDILGVDGSLLTRDRMKECVDASLSADELEFIGAKISSKPSSLSIEKRHMLNYSIINALDLCVT